MDDSLNAVTAARDEAAALMAGKIRQRAALDMEIEDLRAEVEGLNHYIARHGGDTSPSIAPDPDTANRWRGMARTDAVAEVLHLIGGAAAPRDIAARLKQFGREDNPGDVGRALYRLKNQGRAQSGGHGRWLPANPDDAEADESDASSPLSPV
jgi:hypothetical protein